MGGLSFPVDPEWMKPSRAELAQVKPSETKWSNSKPIEIKAKLNQAKSNQVKPSEPNEICWNQVKPSDT